jgi:hypothetical protein
MLITFKNSLFYRLFFYWVNLEVSFFSKHNVFIIKPMKNYQETTTENDDTRDQLLSDYVSAILDIFEQ